VRCFRTRHGCVEWAGRSFGSGKNGSEVQNTRTKSFNSNQSDGSFVAISAERFDRVVVPDVSQSFFAAMRQEKSLRIRKRRVCWCFWRIVCETTQTEVKLVAQLSRVEGLVVGALWERVRNTWSRRTPLVFLDRCRRDASETACDCHCPTIERAVIGIKRLLRAGHRVVGACRVFTRTMPIRLIGCRS